MVKFEYKGKIYAPSDLDKKLKKLGITKDDITILEEWESKAKQIQTQMIGKVDNANEKLYIYWNKKLNGWSVLKDNFLDYKKISKSYKEDPNWIFMGTNNENENETDAIRRYWKGVMKRFFNVEIKERLD